MAMNKQTSRVIKGFIVTPIILSFIFAFSLSFMVFFTETEHSKITLFFVGIMGWFIHSIPFAAIIFIALGIPGYIYLNKSGYKELKHYLISGVVIGITAPLIALFFIESVKWWAFILSPLSVLLASFIFWRISIKP